MRKFLLLLGLLMVTGSASAQTELNSQKIIAIQQARIQALEGQVKQLTASTARLIRADFTGGLSQGPTTCQESCTGKSATCVGAKHIEFYGGGGFSGSYWAARSCDYKAWSTAQCLCSIYENWPSP